MGLRVISYLVAATIVAPAVAAAQTSQGGSDPRVRVQPRVVIQQQRERERERRESAQGREEQTEKISRSIRIGGNGELLVSNLAGDITITRAGGNEVQIEATKIARARTVEEAKEMLSLVRVDFIERGSRLEVRTVYPQWDRTHPQQRRNVNVSVAIHIAAPAQTRVMASSLSGNIKITDIKGELSASTFSGDVNIATADRVSKAESKSGQVEISNTNSEIPLEVNSLSGNVVVRQVKAPRLELGTVSGNVVITDVQSTQIEAQSLSGDVEFASPFAKGGRYEFNSHSGTVRITVGGGSGFEFEATTFSGSIQPDPSLNLKIESDGGERGRRRQRSLRGIYGDGSAVVEITTFSGRVILTKK